MSISFIHLLELLGTFSFAASGAFAAMEKRLDPFGVIIISFITAIGGGTIRDILIGELPVAWLTDASSIWVISLAAVCTLLFGSYLKKMDRMLFVFDALGLGLFTMIGIQKGIAHNFSPGICVMLGTITGCFGGVLRDVVLNNVPLIFQKEIYALASIIGGISALLMLSHLNLGNLSYTIATLITFFIRLLAVQYNWSLPKIYLKKANR